MSVEDSFIPRPFIIPAHNVLSVIQNKKRITYAKLFDFFNEQKMLGDDPDNTLYCALETLFHSNLIEIEGLIPCATITIVDQDDDNNNARPGMRLRSPSQKKNTAQLAEKNRAAKGASGQVSIGRAAPKKKEKGKAPVAVNTRAAKGKKHVPIGKTAPKKKEKGKAPVAVKTRAAKGKKHPEGQVPIGNAVPKKKGKGKAPIKNRDSKGASGKIPKGRKRNYSDISLSSDGCMCRMCCCCVSPNCIPHVMSPLIFNNLGESCDSCQCCQCCECSEE